jgi:protoheme IX farnesyltransferase
MAESMPNADGPEVSHTFLGDLWSLGKPRLSSLVIFTAGGGMFLAGGSPSIQTVLAGMFGTTLVVCSANSLNNYIERESDKLMTRTRTRPLPAGRMQPWIALVYGIVLLSIALPWMFLSTTALAAGLAAFAWVVYVFVYTPMKRRSWLSVLAGGLAGAMPPLIGWTAVRGTIEPGGLALFLILFMWQLPHTFAIGLYRKDDYAAAGLKVLPTEQSDAITRQHIMTWTVGLVASNFWAVHLGMGGALTLAGTLGLGGVFLWKAWTGLKTEGGPIWARDLFLFSLVYLSGMFVLMALDHVIYG